MKILVVDDDQEIVDTLKDQLTAYFIIETAQTGEEGEFLAQVNDYDLIILDYLLPDISGLEICQKLRENNIKTPILMLTGKDEVAEKVKALNVGIDDYLTKPFNFDELLARIKALLRRPHPIQSNLINVGDLTIDLDKGVVRRGQKVIHLRRKELYLLEYLARNVGRVISREMILEHVWDSTEEPLTNTVDVHIKYLRDHVDREFNKKLIKTVHGLGYKLEA
ncbi:response regulator transcription factor [Candidatus Microgenomates bacterium]|nr:response regulator transcription factor [Candidatus Microgenomates bacterium]